MGRRHVERKERVDCFVSSHVYWSVVKGLKVCICEPFNVLARGLVSEQTSERKVERQVANVIL